MTSQLLSRVALIGIILITLSSASFAQTTAIPASDFLNSIGACTHIGQGVDNAAQSATAMKYAGIRNLRDDGRSSHIQDWITVYQQSGVKTALLTDHNITSTISMAKQLHAAGALLAIDGPNEPNNWPVAYQGDTSSSTTSLPIAKFQRDLYAAVKADTSLAHIPVFHSSEAGGSEPDNCGLQFLVIPAGAGTLMPDGTKYADYANTHNYVCGTQNKPLGDNQAWSAADPTLNGQWDGLWVEYGHTWWGAGFNGYTANELQTLPRVTTETGWITSGGSNNLTQEQQGRLFLNLYLSQFKRGWKYTFIYMLRDDPNQGYWGLFNTNYTPKISGTYLHNFTKILGDTGVIASSGQISYSIPSQPSTVHDLLLQKHDGTFELVIWSEKASGSSAITVNLGKAFSTVRIYDPIQDTLPAQTLTNASSASLSLSDHPIILEIPSPASVTPSFPQLSDAVGFKVTCKISSSGNVLIKYWLPAVQNVKISLYEGQGRLIGILEAGWKEAGWHMNSLPVDHHEKGMLLNKVCFLRIQANHQSIVKKLPVLR